MTKLCKRDKAPPLPGALLATGIVTSVK
ncbi:hypothetical protein AGR13a_Lc10047 [Agrobacterium genomosp. 13 str. CFBP 6927]|uniref:Uncharacterized protein n=1 Tax=Agrobacterium genomosp. 13 str. CFBP 6927 TaxID=1183428 RepID=A0ABP2BKL8_9HYPH|nr:hypothetical protein AGR13a_Lc10047 [Agrobacterium genomosp. 13 str. CFBP 6927]